MKTAVKIIIPLLLVSGFFSCAQYKAPPSYLTEQAFPDSVMQVKFNTLAGESTFAQLLEKHEGKKIVIDFWASWCKDCIVGLPKVTELMKKTKKSDVAYVFISVDEDAGKWKMAIDKFSIQGDHFQTQAGWKNALTNYINLDWIPRYIVIDEHGKVIVPKAISADDEALVKAVSP